MLELKNVSKSYRSIPAVTDVSFVLREGDDVLGYTWGRTDQESRRQ